MSTAALPTAFSNRTYPLRPPAASRSGASAKWTLAASVVRRRPTREQGLALEVLGHAVEYLVDSRLYFLNQSDSSADTEAVRILMRHSREVFASCQEITPARLRFIRWVSKWLFGTSDSTESSVR